MDKIPTDGARKVAMSASLVVISEMEPSSAGATDHIENSYTVMFDTRIVDGSNLLHTALQDEESR